MNSKIIAATVIAFASLSSVSAFAGGESQDFFSTPASSSTVSRAQVQGDYFKAQKEGTLARGGESADFVVAPVASIGLSRNQVRAEAVIASRAPLANEYHGTN